MVAKIVIPPNVPVNDLYATANMTASNALTTTNVFATNVVATGQMTILGTGAVGKASLLVTGNVIVSNALVTGNVFTNTFVLNDTIQVTQGNIYVSNTFVTTNVYVTGKVISTASLTDRYADGFSIVVPTGNAYVSNAVTTSNVVTSNVVTSGNVVVHNTVSTGFTTLDVVGNAYVSNAVTVSNIATTNVYVAGTVTATATSDIRKLTMSVTGNAYVSNSLSTNNVFAAGNVFAGGTITVTGNTYVSNAVTTTNVLTTNVLATGQMIVTGDQTTGYTALNVGGNVAVSNAFVVPPTGLGVFAGNVITGGILTVTTATASGVLALNVAGNVAVSNALATIDDVFTGNTVAAGLLTVANLGKTDKFTALTVGGNVVASNALTTTNVFVGNNVYATGNLFVQGDSSVNGLITLTGNVYASNAVVTTNIYANMWSSNLTTTVVVTGNMYTRNNITTQNLFTTNVFAATSVQVNNTGLTVDPLTGGIIVSTVSSGVQAQVYPPSAMSGYTLTVPGGGTYTASASSEQGTQLAWKAFDGRSGFDNVDNVWKSNGGGYNGSTGSYGGAVSTSGYQGEWVQLRVPVGVTLTGYTITPYLGSTGVYSQNPRKWYILGSNDASGWTLLDTRSGVTSWTPGQDQTFSVTPTVPYTYYRLVVNEIQNGAPVNTVIGDWSLSGTTVSPLPINARNLPVYVETGVTSTVFPPSAMSADSTVISGGTYVASASSIFGGTTFPPYLAFDKNAATFWHMQGTAAYSTTTNQYIGTTTTNFSTTVGGVPYYGEWLQLRLPTANVLSSYAITSRASLGAQAPATFYIMGSNDDTTFTLIDTQTSVSWLAGGGETKTFTASSPYPFTRYRIVIGAVSSGSVAIGYTSIASWDLNCLSTIGFNIGDEYYNGQYVYKMMGANPAWRSIARPVLSTPVIGAFPLISTSGGTETTPTNFKLHAFTTAGASTLTVSGGPAYADVLVVGAGGSGGSRVRGGGGAGGVLFYKNYLLTPGTYTATIGTGGASVTSSPFNGNNGGNTTFAGPGITTITAYGGGGGNVINPGAVASGGGTLAYAGRIQGTIIGQGYEGGDGTYNIGTGIEGSYSGGGGGGAGGPGNNGDLRQIANGASGGRGLFNEITRTDVDVTSGLVLRIPFDGTIVDTIGAKTFTTSGTAVYSGGVNGGQCASFRPASGGTPIWYTSCPSPITQPPFSVSFWFKPTDVMPYYGTVFGMSPTASPPSTTAYYNADIHTYPRTADNFAGSIGHYIAFPSQWNQIYATAGPGQINTTFTMNTWNHITVTATSAWVVKGYVNGALTSQATGTGNFPANIARLYIGANADGNQNRSVNGDLQDFRIYNRAITDREVAQLGRLNHFGGGGGGDTSTLNGGFCGQGGLGGGGRGGGGGTILYRPTSTYGAPGTDGTGGGGGGGAFNGGTDYASGKGGNGAVYVRVRTNTDVVINSRCETARVIPVTQTLPIAAVGPVRWTISGAPTGVYLDSMQSTGCNIIIPVGTYTAGTYACTLTAFNVNNNSSTASVNIIVQLETTGGSISYETAGYRTHYFLTPGVDTFNVIGQGTAEILIVGGGGGGGCGYQGGGGGGGGIVYSASKAVSTGSFSVCVGQAGLGSIQSAASFGRSTNGGESYVAGLGLAIAVGGGGGAGEPFLPSYLNPSPAALSGGSGGGGSWGSSSLSAGSGTTGQGNAGGTAFNGANYTGAGGGGAGGVGANSTATSGGNGGNGAAYSITGSSKTYSGGGGGSYRGSGTSNGTGGTGGGGAGVGNGNGQFATYYGGGGGAGGSIVGAANRGGNGHQGIVIIRVPIG